MKVKIPFILAILGMVGGVFISILFGINEDIFKDKIAKDLRANEKIMSIVDEAERESKIKAEESKNWRYYQRFHFHATGISAMTLGSLLLLAFSLAPAGLKLASSYMISIGGFLYPFIWLFAGIYGPSIGRSEAKESFAIFGYMGGIFLLGLVLASVIVIVYPLVFVRDEQARS
ncbi:MAG: hypothetical protein CME71_08830 [Halobacteriovorax sp.]|nr:hypothetical protein [Halobacteriovorax sp.]